MKNNLFKTKNYIVITIGLLVFSLGILFIAKQPSSDLNAILESSTVFSDLKTGTEVGRWQQDKGTTLGMPTRAELKIEYEPNNTDTKEEVFGEIETILKKNKWEREKANIPQSVYYTLPLAHISIIAKVRIQTDRNIVDVNLVAVPR